MKVSSPSKIKGRGVGFSILEGITARATVIKTGQKRGSETHAFTLIELLIVINIVIYFFWIMAPSFSSIAQGVTITEAAFTISSVVERARSEAVGRKSYVWLGIQEEINEGNLALRLGIVCSKDGSANTNSSNLLPIGKAVLIPRMGLFSSSTVVLGNEAPTNGAIDLADVSSGMIFQIGQTKFTDGRTITFMPLGEVTTNPVPTASSGFDPLLVVSIEQARGTNIISGNNVTVAIEGSVGIPTIYRQ
jgi:type II secretory pathway pseudopilin PulG